MANSKMKGKRYKLPPNLSSILGSEDISYEYLKKIKHYYENIDPSCSKYGGAEMKNFVENTLKTNRNSIKRSSKIKSELGLGNGFKEKHTKDKHHNINNTSKINIPRPATTANRIFNDDAIYEEIKRIKNLITYKSKI